MRHTPLVLLIGLGGAVHSQEQAPQLLIRAAQCLAVKSNFPASRATARTFGYVLDEKSYAGEKVLYVVNYAAPARSCGLAFTIFLTEHDGHQVFDIQNNASFVLSKGGLHGVSFVNPPLGGTWTEEHLASAIKRIEKQPRYTISVENPLALDSSITCASYTDLQPKPSKLPPPAGHSLSPNQAELVAAWLASHPEYRAATDADCGCEDDISQMRAGYGGIWKPMPDYHPYVVTGDFNNDGATDFAIVLIDRGKPAGQYAVLIFSGPLRVPDQRPAFFKAGLDLKYHGFFYGPPRKKPYRLVLGRFEAEGEIFVPEGGTYKMTGP